LKKILAAIIIITFSGVMFYFFYPAKAIELVINDENIEAEEPVAIEDEEELYVHAELFLEELGVKTVRDENSKTLSGTLGEFSIGLSAGSRIITVDGKAEYWDWPVIMVDDIIYTPVMPAAEALGVFAEWDEEARIIYISTPQEFDPEVADDRPGPLLHVAYPPEQRINYYADSLFVFGTTSSYSQVEVLVNGRPVDMLNMKTGNFLTMVDIPRGEEFTVKVEAREGNEVTSVERSVLYPAPLQPMPADPLELHSSHLIPSRDQVLNPGDTVVIAVRGSPGATASYQIGARDPAAMTELQYPSGPRGSGGIYAASYTVRAGDAPASGLSAAVPVTVTLTRGGEEIKRELPGKLAFTSDFPYKIVEVRNQSELDFRGWFRVINQDYYQLYSDTRSGTGYPDHVAGFLTPGTRFETVGVSGEYYRVSLGGSRIYLLHKDVVREVENVESLGAFLPAVELTESGDKVSLTLNSSERFPFLVDSTASQIRVRMYGLRKADGLVLPDLSGSALAELKLEPMGSGSGGLVMTADLDVDFTGYTPYWEGTGLVIEIKKPPAVDREKPLEGRTIVIDPGHGGEDTGAPGPGDLHEKDVVLRMSMYLRELLIEEGARVIMTRTADEDVGLYDRPAAGDLQDTDFFISVHANAHAAGANAVDLHGIMVLYNYDHNKKLADMMLETVSREMGLPAMTAWRRNIAVTRHTQFPCVLVEAGYMMHPEDNWYILHPWGQQKFARAMKDGIMKYFLSFD